MAGEDYIYRGNTLNAILNIAHVTRREEDLNFQQMLSDGEAELFRVKRNKAEIQAES